MRHRSEPVAAAGRPAAASHVGPGSHRRPPAARRRVLAAGQWALLVVGVLLGGYWLEQQSATWLLNARYRGRWSASSAAGPGAAIPPATAGAVIGRIEIPDVGVRALILEGADDTALGRGIGHVPGTSLPGTGGNVVLAGHRDTHFRGLRDIEKGDAIRVTTDRGYRYYRVTSTSVVAPGDTAVLDATAEDRLTLITCYPFTFVGAAPNRFIVHAESVPDPRSLG